jgi:hypothetical protein
MTLKYWLDFLFLAALVSAVVWIGYLAWAYDRD